MKSASPVKNGAGGMGTTVNGGLTVLLSIGFFGCLDGAGATSIHPVRETASNAVIDATYKCKSGREIAARYDNTDKNAPTAQLKIGDRLFDLYQVVSASGARYATERGFKPDMGLQWWVKGNSATLSEMLLDHAALEPTLIDTCTVQQTR